MTTTTSIHEGGARTRLGIGILAVLLPFALGGATAAYGIAGRVTFAVCYLISAAATLVLVAELRRWASTPGTRLLAALTGLLLLLAALAHGIEAALVLGHLSDSISAADRSAGALAGALQVFAFAGVALGTLALCLLLWRCRLTPAWPALLILLLAAANQLPHGTTQQLTRSALIAVLAFVLFTAIRRTPAPREPRSERSPQPRAANGLR